MTVSRDLIGDIETADVVAITKIVCESADSARLAWEVVHDAINAKREAVIEALVPMLSSKDRVFALALAAEEGLLNVVRKLVPLTEPSAKDSMALVCAARAGRKDVVELLLPVSDALADHSAALYEASACGHADVVKLLIPHSDPYDKDSRALAQAAHGGHLRVVKLLLPVSSSIICATQIFPAAAGHGATEVVKLMLKAKLPDAAHTYAAAFDLAASKGQFEVVELILGAIDQLGRPRRFGEKAIYDAASKGYREIAELLAPTVGQSACNAALVGAVGHAQRETARVLFHHANLDEVRARLFSPEHHALLDELAAEATAQQDREALNKQTQLPIGSRSNIPRL
ncbi:ankyrin repeat domain-containing protein [Stenotrophomonas maltophilia]|uniref:ankyrin repeat domain-containing protein n=1 Tax=Stenotrophomonas maltophilia TaxID=40324 RepID=UPI0018D49465|nr:ankyrin repeat domain-containing protein [Stenotrophomonas maltophilia]MBH1524169.1 ankyrin repeat domain-containing protein [Stenotrophomonas maltophilia]MBH1646707.1 ankyrin repeat domain-containing protein [Stenotrophomonas maltophilia]MCO7475000.1 ankyrin repeat domain-containing protein [Stenotrophomonas maltophilia]UVH71546.1 ankyrin repeat domain-containing protein [Stenotrophomonas maltophilia]